MATTVDLALVREAICDVLKAVDALDGIVVDDTMPGIGRNHATVNRDLLNLSDQLLLASSLVKNECWTGTGVLSHPF
jgi:hypothetical protein